MLLSPEAICTLLEACNRCKREETNPHKSQVELNNCSAVRWLCHFFCLQQNHHPYVVTMILQCPGGHVEFVGFQLKTLYCGWKGFSTQLATSRMPLNPITAVQFCTWCAASSGMCHYIEPYHLKTTHLGAQPFARALSSSIFGTVLANDIPSLQCIVPPPSWLSVCIAHS